MNTDSSQHASHTGNVNNDDVFDEGLLCISCEYNLTGIESECCPECGCIIDWGEVKRRSRLESDRPGTHWERWHGTRKAAGFLITTFRAAFLPWRFAQDVPSIPRIKPALGFAVVCVAISIVTGQIFDKPDIAGYIAWYSGVVCHILLQTAILGFLLPASRLRYGFRFWLVISLYTTYPIMTEAITEPPYFTSNYSNIWPLSRNSWVPSLHYYLWWAGLILIADSRVSGWRRKWIVLLLFAIPMMTYVSSYVGCQVSELF